MKTPKGNPLPTIIHAVLTKEQLGQGRIIVIGDIHGCSQELADLLEKAQYQAGLDTLVSVGDLVGKGPNSIQVLREAQRLGMITVRGNWDEGALAVGVAIPRAALEKKWAWLAGAEQRDFKYLHSMPFSLSIPSHGCIVVHAGLLPNTPLQDQDLNDLIEMRHVDLVDPPPPSPDGTSSRQKWKALPKFPREAGQPWATVWPGPHHVIFGHHARRRLQACSFASGIDTGCCLGDQLTALILPPVSELEAKGWTPSLKGVTREDLGAQLVSCQARQVYRVDDKD